MLMLLTSRVDLKKKNRIDQIKANDSSADTTKLNLKWNFCHSGNRLLSKIVKDGG